MYLMLCFSPCQLALVYSVYHEICISFVKRPVNSLELQQQWLLLLLLLSRVNRLEQLLGKMYYRQQGDAR